MNRVAEISPQDPVGAAARGDLSAITSAVTDHRHTPLGQLDGSTPDRLPTATRPLGPTFNSAI